MPRALSLLGYLVQTLSETGRGAPTGEVSFAGDMEEVARDTLARARVYLSPAEIRAELQGLATVDPTVYTDLVRQTLTPLVSKNPTLGDTLRAHLAYWPSTIRQGLRRPSDPAGRTVPAGLSFDDPSELLRLLPPRTARLRAGQVAGIQNWELVRFCGLGERTEVWAGRHTRKNGNAALKFVMDPTASQLVLENESVFARVFSLPEESGIVPLRAVYPDPKRLCMEYGYAPGYDLGGVMFDWKLRWGRPMADPAAGLARRLAEVVAKAHARRFVHRGLKPSNAILMPAEGARITLWVTDFGWGHVTAALATAEPGASQHLRARGGDTSLYLAPQVMAGEPADPRDDVYAIGLIWYQLLVQDSASLPDGEGWAESLAEQGVPEEHLALLENCLAKEAVDRPADATILSRWLNQLPASPPPAPVLPPPTRTTRSVNTGPPSGAFTFDAKSAIGASDPMSGKFVPTPGPVTTTLSANVAIGRGRRTGMVANSIGMTFAPIPAGRFMMGAEDDADHAFVGDELPQHPVCITRPFFLSLFQVTQVEFLTVMGRNPSYFNVTRKGSPSHPAESVTWADAELFCKKLSKLADEVAAGRRYRLPTEAEWEYACRANTRTAFWCGAKLSAKAANFSIGNDKLRPEEVTVGSTLPVGQFRPNVWGLYDMHGNVAEWVSDWYSDAYYSESPTDDPAGPATGSAKVIRGGSWQSLWSECRSSARDASPPERGTNRIGFRVVMIEGE